jgi:S-adenosylmethionine:tRNA ribosyltransferase-isomerase
VPPLCTSDFDYHLPAELIAQEPSAERGESRLLVVRSEFRVPRSELPDPEAERGTRNAERFEDLRFEALVGLIPPGDLVVVNTTRVRHARFLGRRPSGAPAEVLLIHPGRDARWIAIGKPGSALRPGKRIEIAPGAYIETLALLEEGYREVRFVGITAEEAMRHAGRLPLPPYIAREPTVQDESRYQTVYAERAGSVAAPTAGLHFTPAMLAALERKGVGLARLDRAVGQGEAAGSGEALGGVEGEVEHGVRMMMVVL